MTIFSIPKLPIESRRGTNKAFVSSRGKKNIYNMKYILYNIRCTLTLKCCKWGISDWVNKYLYLPFRRLCVYITLLQISLPVPFPDAIELQQLYTIHRQLLIKQRWLLDISDLSKSLSQDSKFFHDSRQDICLPILL